MSFNPFFSLQGPLGKTKADGVRVSKNELRFGPLSITRCNVPPPMNYGRPGDYILIDSTDRPDIIQSNENPVGVGMWIKVPMGHHLAPLGNVVIGRNAPTVIAGHALMINSIVVALGPGTNAAQVVTNINAAVIPNIIASVLGDVVLIRNITGGQIEISNVIGFPVDALGLYSQPALSVFSPNGVWIPMLSAPGSGSGGAPTTASYLTLTPDPGLTDSRSLIAGPGISTIDGGPGGTYTIQQNITGTAAIAEPVDLLDQLLVHNVSNNTITRITVNDLPAPAGGPLGLEHRTLTFTSAGGNIGIPVAAGSRIRRIYLSVLVAYNPGTTIVVGDAGDPDRLMTVIHNDPTEINIFETTPDFTYIAATQLVVTIVGTGGTATVVIEVDVP
jgi:hypothetical protein